MEHEAPRAVASEPDLTVLGVGRSSPFRGDRFLVRTVPFAAAAALAELSLFLPPGVTSAQAAWLSGALLAATVLGVAFIPWGRVPAQATVVMPLLYIASVLALTLATRANSGIGVVVLVPLLWTALFHEWWESGCVVAGVITYELVISVAQHALDATVFRRLVLWALSGVAISVAVHGLRGRVRDAHHQTQVLNARLREAEKSDDRLRIALGLQDEVVRRIFATTLTLTGATQLETNEKASEVVADAVTELDETLAVLRGTIFDLETEARRQMPPTVEAPSTGPAPSDGRDSSELEPPTTPRPAPAP